MMGRYRIYVIFLGLLLGISGNLLGAEYFVSPSGSDSDPGTRSRPWKTLEKANLSLKAGDTVYLLPGEYINQQIKPANSGTQGKYISYVGVTSSGKPVITDVNIAINLDNKSYIRIEKIVVDGKKEWPNCNIQTWVSMINANYNIIRNCEFYHALGWKGIWIDEGSHHNQILDNIMEGVGAYSDSKNQDYGDMIYIRCGKSNLIQGNTLKRGGHNLLIVWGNYNVIRHNLFDNSWGSNKGNRSLELTHLDGRGCSDQKGGYNLFEWNIIQNTLPAIDKKNPPAIKVQGVNQIVRFNIFINNVSHSIQTGINRDGMLNIKNKIYNNVFYNNGGPAWRVYAYNPSFDNIIDQNVFMNNIVYKNHLAPIGNDGKYDVMWDSDIYFSIEISGDPLHNNVIRNNSILKETPGDGVIAIKGIGENQVQWFQQNYGQNFIDNVSIVPQINSNSSSLFKRFVSNSNQLNDTGAFLTHTISSGSGTILEVEDAGFFSDGFSIVDGDEIQLERNRSVAKIVDVDYQNNRIYVDRPLTWQKGQGVSFPFTGAAPNIGIPESSSITVDTTPPQPPPRPVVKVKQ